MSGEITEEGMNIEGVKEWCAAVSQDLEQIAVLHDREVDKNLIIALREVGFPYNLGIQINAGAQIKPSSSPTNKTEDSTDFPDPLGFMKKALDSLPETLGQTILDKLASDYADIYLTHAIHASPYESVWLDEDHLMQQEPMFKVREWYERYGLASEDWRIRSDDHLALQLQFIAFLLNPNSDKASMGETFPMQKRIEDAAQFMDEHLLLWLADFSHLVMQRCMTDFYASAAILTYVYIDQLRDTLAMVTGISRPTAEDVRARLAVQNMVEEPVKFMPGISESW